MAVLLYARVSTARQAERELSLPAQFHLMERYAKDHDLTVVGRYQDIGSGKSLRERSGLLAAIREATKERSIDGLLVHKIDRLSRDTFNYLVLKGKLKSAGVRIYSVVESLEASPMGEFMEHIMAAQAEFYSANLATEVKKGLDERLRRGQWAGLPPIGYRMERGRVVVDPARAPHIRKAFERWATGTITSANLATELHLGGLVGTHGGPIRASMLCRVLQNPFYKGLMVAGGSSYPGIHPPLVSPELFERCQEVFRQKHGSGRRVRSRLIFILARLVACPQCGTFLIGEEHRKSSRKVYRYYRCHQRMCRFYLQADAIESAVIAELLKLDLPKRLVPRLRAMLREQHRTEAETIRLRNLRSEREALERKRVDLLRRHADGRLTENDYQLQYDELRLSLDAVETLITMDSDADASAADQSLLDTLTRLEEYLSSTDVVVRRRAIVTCISRVSVFGPTPALTLTEGLVRLSTVSSYHSPCQSDK